MGMQKPALGLALAATLVGAVGLEAQGIRGRWDLTARQGRETYPLWLEVLTGPPAGGRYQARYGHALPLVGTTLTGNQISFPLPAENPSPSPGRFTARLEGDSLTGEITLTGGGTIAVVGRRAPSLVRARPPLNWGRPVNLIEGGMSAWRLRDAGGRNGWSIASGQLVNTPPSTDLVTVASFDDFRLHVEVQVPPDGNSGIYLRGRYEVQVADSYGKEPSSRGMGGIYGQVTPMSLPARPAGEWQTLDITLVGRRVTVVLNGTTIMDQAEIPGITGGALDSDESAPGPIMLQGDHSGVRYRNIRIVPAAP
jgi:hypothetical protein